MVNRRGQVLVVLRLNIKTISYTAVTGGRGHVRPSVKPSQNRVDEDPSKEDRPREDRPSEVSSSVDTSALYHALEGSVALLQVRERSGDGREACLTGVFDLLVSIDSLNFSD